MSENSNNPNDIHDEMKQAQKDLQEALNALLTNIGDKLKTEEVDRIKKEVQELDEILERLKDGAVWIAFFGKTCAGKSSVINSLVEKDVAEVDVLNDTTKSVDTYPATYQEGKWKLVDVPGIMGNTLYENIAIEEVKKAHGQVFVLDGEPYQDEIEIFDTIFENTPKTPRIVFVNKWDQKELSMPSSDRDKIKQRIYKKMSKYILSENDIVYGSARLFDSKRDQMVRQEIPELLERLYSSAGTLGAIMHVLDPASKAENVTDAIHSKIFAVREKIARKWIFTFGLLSVGATFIPFDTILAAPTIHSNLIKRVIKTLDFEKSTSITEREAGLILEEYYSQRWLKTGLTALVEGALSIGAYFTFGGSVGADFILLSGFKFWQTTILGEVVIQYSKNGFDWGAKDIKETIKECKERAENYYSFEKAKYLLKSNS